MELLLLGTDPVVAPGPQVKLLPWTADPEPYFAQATALINIDAFVEQDVFLSSKLFSYLPYNRPVICQTGADSPSRHLFAGMESVLLCGHNALEIKDALLRAIREFDRFRYEDRLPLLQQASAPNVAQELARELSLLQS